MSQEIRALKGTRLGYWQSAELLVWSHSLKFPILDQTHALPLVTPCRHCQTQTSFFWPFYLKAWIKGSLTQQLMHVDLISDSNCNNITCMDRTPATKLIILLFGALFRASPVSFDKNPEQKVSLDTLFKGRRNDAIGALFQSDAFADFTTIDKGIRGGNLKGIMIIPITFLKVAISEVLLDCV